MEAEIFDILIALSFPLIFVFGVIILVYISRTGMYTLEYDEKRGLFHLYKGRKMIAEIPRSGIEEFVLSFYITRGSKNSRTYYTCGMVLTREEYNRIVTVYPKFAKCPQDANSYRIFVSNDSGKTRNTAESLAKKSGIPLRSISGELRQANELDIPYHEFMSGKIDTFGFPSRYRAGDDFEIREDRDSLEIIIRKKSFLVPILSIIMGGFFFIFFFISGITQGWEMDGWIGIILLIVFTSPLIIGLLISTYFMVKLHYHSTIRIKQGILYLGWKKIPLKELEEVQFTGFAINFITDSKVYTRNLYLYVRITAMQEYFSIIQKAIVYRGLR